MQDIFNCTEKKKKKEKEKEKKKQKYSKYFYMIASVFFRRCKSYMMQLLKW